MLNNAPTILPALEAALAANGPAALRELANALGWKALRATDDEIEAALGVLIERKKIELLPAPKSRNNRYAAR